MALDFTIASGNHELATALPEFSIEFEEHESIYLILNQSPEHFPKLLKFKDYYSDAMLHPMEVEELLKEIEFLISNNSLNEFASPFLNNLKKSAISLSSSQKALYAVCD